MVVNDLEKGGYGSRARFNVFSRRSTDQWWLVWEVEIRGRPGRLFALLAMMEGNGSL